MTNIFAKDFYVCEWTKLKNAKQNVDSNSYMRVSSRELIQCFGIQETFQDRNYLLCY